jgi:hypothetical protein
VEACEGHIRRFETEAMKKRFQLEGSEIVRFLFQ